jgi:small-conductance mechanosensitive channel
MDVDATVLVTLFNPKRLLFAVLVLVGAVFLTRAITGFLDRIGERQARRRLTLKRVATILRFAIFLLSAVVIVSNVFTLNRDALLALGGTIAVTVGFALKDTAASIISGILILIDQPFQVGDRITFGGTYGEVKEIGLRSVRIETLDDNLVSIPTNKFLTEAVASGNAGALDMQIVIDFHIAVDADFDRARRIAYEAAVTSKYVFLNKPVAVLLSDEVTPIAFATRIRVKVYVFDVRYERKIVSDITERVKRQFAREAIHPPYTVERHERSRTETTIAGATP